MSQYFHFKNFIFRTPLLPVNIFFQEMGKLEKEENYWKQFLQDTLLQEAIFLASPVLYDEMGKYLSGYLTKEKNIEKLKNAVLRYFSRMTSRCTPFGLFAGLSLGKFETTDSNLKEEQSSASENFKFSILDSQFITLPSISNYRRFTRLDMHYLCALAQKLVKNETILRSVKYYPNSSLYVLGDQLRYVEYFYKNSRRIHQISSIDFSKYLDKIIMYAQKGVNFVQLVTFVPQLLPEENINHEESKSFILELINNQILVSDLDPEITGKDFLIQLLKVLNEINDNSQFSSELISGLNSQFTIPTVLKDLVHLLKKMDKKTSVNHSTSIKKPKKSSNPQKQITKKITFFKLICSNQPKMLPLVPKLQMKYWKPYL